MKALGAAAFLSEPKPQIVAMARIVTKHYRYQRPPPRKRQAVALEVPALIKVAAKAAPPEPTPATSAVVAANDDRKPAIVTIRRRGRFDDVHESLGRDGLRAAT